MQTPLPSHVAVRLCAAFTLLLLCANPALAQRPSNSRLSGPGIDMQPGTVWVHCWAEFQYDTSDFYWVTVLLRVKDQNGAIIATASDENWWYGYAEIIIDLTYTGTYTCEAEWYVNYHRVGGDAKQLGAFLTILDITINTFIPMDNVHDPFPWRDVTWEGDDREFARNGSSRASMTLSILQPKAVGGLIETGPFTSAGITAVYDIPTSLDAAGRLTWSARNDWIRGYPEKLDYEQSSGSSMSCTAVPLSNIQMTLECHMNEDNPLHRSWGWFGVTYDFYIDFWFYDDGRVEYLVQGQHDGFPNYEIYVGNQELYTHDLRHHGQGLWSLGRPAEFTGLFYPGMVW